MASGSTLKLSIDQSEVFLHQLPRKHHPQFSAYNQKTDGVCKSWSLGIFCDVFFRDGAPSRARFHLLYGRGMAEFHGLW